MVAVRRIGETKLQLRIDSVIKEQTISGFDVSQTAYPLFVGASFGSFQSSFAFRIAEMLAVHRTGGNNPITDLEVQSIEKYLKAKYKTP